MARRLHINDPMSAHGAPKQSDKPATDGKKGNNAAPHGIEKQKHPDAQREKDARERQEGKPGVLPKK